MTDEEARQRFDKREEVRYRVKQILDKVVADRVKILEEEVGVGETQTATIGSARAILNYMGRVGEEIADKVARYVVDGEY